MSFLPERKALEMLGGEQEERIDQEGKLVKFMIEGGGYWNVPDKKEWEFFFNHVMLEYNVAIYVAKQLKEIGKEKNIDELANIDVREAATASLLSDIGKRRAKEEMRFNKKKEDEHGKTGQKMLEEAGFSENISRVAASHDFPTSEDQLVNIYDKIALFTDMIASQKYVTPKQRIDDIEERWIIQKKEQGKKPLIDEKIFSLYKEVALKTADDILKLLGEEPEEFIKNIPQTREEKYLRELFEKDLEDRAIKFADNLDKIRE